MKSQGVIVLLLLAAGMISAGCFTNPATIPQSGENSLNTPVETPTLPDQYVASPVGTPGAGSGSSTVTPNLTEDIPLISPAQYTTINATNITGNATNSSTTIGSISIPVAQFTSNVTLGFAPLAVQFTDSSQNMPTVWSWNFGDGGSSTLQNPGYTFYSGGQYMVVFTATNAAGSSDFTTNISVYSPGFLAVPNQGPHPLTVAFTDAGTGYPQPSAWYWDFGDGMTSSFRNSTHQYILPGTYDVKFRITSTAGMAWVNRSAAVTVT